MNCLAHKLNLCLTKYGMHSVSEYKEFVSKCKLFVEFFRYKGPEVIAKQEEIRSFLENVVEEDHTYCTVTEEVGNTSIKKYTKTRWNSLYTCLKSILVNKLVISLLLRVNKKRELILERKEIRALEKFTEFLEIFKSHSERMQADRNPTICVPLEVEV